MNIARRTLHLSSMMLIAIMLVGFTSCASEDFFLEEVEGKSLSIQVATTGQAQTRSIGEEDLNENLLSRLDYFFFKADANNNATGTLVYHLSETNQTSQIDHEYRSGLSDEMLTGLFGSLTPEDGVYCYIYVVTNFDGFTNDNITVGSTTLADIQNITFNTTLSTNAAQPSFVMAGGSPVQLRKVNGAYYRLATSRPIPVTRAAAKIDLVVYDVQQYTDPDPNDGSRWKSHPENMYVMFYNGVSKSYIYADAGHYITNPENSDYFSVRGSNMRQMTEILTETGGHTGRYEHSIPFYSYMSNWNSDADRMSCLILVLPWEHVDSNGQPMSDGYQSTYYQIPTSLDKRYLENHYYKIEVTIGMIGSFEEPTPVILKDNTYMVVDWGTVSEDAAVRESSYLIVETNHYVMNNVNTASVSYISSHNLKYAYVSNVAFKELKTFETKNKPNNTPSMNGTFTTDTYTYTDNNGRETGHLTGEAFTVTASDGIITLTHPISENQYTQYDVTVKIVNEANPNLEEEIVFTIFPAIKADKVTGGNVFINGRFGYVIDPEHASGGNWYRHVENGVNAYSWSRNIRTAANPDIVDSGEGANIATNYTNTNSTTYGASYYGPIITQDPATGNALGQRDITRITISSFSSDDNYYTLGGTHYYNITDPRVPWSTSNDGTLADYIVTNRSYVGNIIRDSWNTSNLKVGTDDLESIAPDLLIGSAWGRPNPHSMTFEVAKKRCATYQEAGYPGGRWRLPTVAELAYMFKLQLQGVIPKLFSTNSTQYTASNGHCYRIYDDGRIEERTSEYNSCRCVYDVWYWGESPMSTNGYHAEP